MLQKFNNLIGQNQKTQYRRFQIALISFFGIHGTVVHILCYKT